MLETPPSYYNWLLSSTGQYYFTIPKNVTTNWKSASDYCSTMGATLPIFRSAEEESAYQDLM